MFGDLLGNIEAKQKEIKEKLKLIPIEVQIENGSVQIQGNASREIKNIHIDPKYTIEHGLEGLEDLLVVAMNQFMEAVAQAESEHTQSFMKDMMPPGLSNLFNS